MSSGVIRGLSRRAKANTFCSCCSIMDASNSSISLSVGVGLRVDPFIEREPYNICAPSARAAARARTQRTSLYDPEPAVVLLRLSKNIATAPAANSTPNVSATAAWTWVSVTMASSPGFGMPKPRADSSADSLNESAFSTVSAPLPNESTAKIASTMGSTFFGELEVLAAAAAAACANSAGYCPEVAVENQGVCVAAAVHAA